MHHMQLVFSWFSSTSSYYTVWSFYFNSFISEAIFRYFYPRYRLNSVVTFYSIYFRLWITEACSSIFDDFALNFSFYAYKFLTDLYLSVFSNCDNSLNYLLLFYKASLFVYKHFFNSFNYFYLCLPFAYDSLSSLFNAAIYFDILIISLDIWLFCYYFEGFSFIFFKHSFWRTLDVTPNDDCCS